MGYTAIATEADFAERSARYLANNGYRSDEITRALVDELDITTNVASQIVTSIAA